MEPKPIEIADGMVVTLDYKMTAGDLVVDTTAEDDPIIFLQGHAKVIAGLEKALYGLKAGESKEFTVAPHNAYGFLDPEDIHEVPREEFPEDFPIEQGMTLELDGEEDEDLVMATVLDVTAHTVTLDFNHPLAGKELVFSSVIGKVAAKDTERGGSSVDWMAELANGPGMQGRWQSHKTDFFSADAFRREDETPDSRFYSEPRYVQHIDDTAIEIVKNTYDRFLKDDMDVLDLMSSWQSHIPSKLRFIKLTGLGLNGEELDKNEILDDHSTETPSYYICFFNSKMVHKTIDIICENFHSIFCIRSL